MYHEQEFKCIKDIDITGTKEEIHKKLEILETNYAETVSKNGLKNCTFKELMKSMRVIDRERKIYEWKGNIIVEIHRIINDKPNKSLKEQDFDR